MKGDDGLKIKLAISDESYEKVERILIEKGIEIDDNATFVLTECEKFISHLSVRNPLTNEKFFISTDEIVFIESFGHVVEVHTDNNIFQTTEPLYQLCYVLDRKIFIRISNSVIISRKRVSKIQPSFSQKFVLYLTDGSKVAVTRSYYHSFREFFNI